MDRGVNGHHSAGDLRHLAKDALGRDKSRHHVVTAEELVRETVSNFESLDGFESVEWVTQSPYATFHELIRVRTRRGKTIRLAMAYIDDDEEEDAFDDCFQ